MITRCPLPVRVCTVASLFAVAALSLGGCSSNKSSKSMASKPEPVAPAAAPENEAWEMAFVAEPEPESDDYTELTRGQTFIVRLPTYCGSQRAWRISPKSAEDRFVKLLDRQSQQVEPGMSDTLDARSWDIFTFRATKPGETNLEFVYDQPWSPDQAAVRTHILTCNITPPLRNQGKLQQASVTVE